MAVESVLFGLASIVPPPRARGLSVLCYHRVAPARDGGLDRFDVTRAALAAHLAAIRADGRTIAEPATLTTAPAGAVLLTFDDSLPSHAEHALPVLRDAGVHAIFFLTPDEIGAAGRLGPRGVDALLAAGMHVGAHGYAHVAAVELPPDAFERAARDCAAFLTALGMPLRWAYPYGHLGSFGAVHERILRDHGFALRFSTLEGRCDPADDGRPQGRYVIRRDSTRRYVRAAAGGGLQLVGLAKRLRAATRQAAARQATAHRAARH